MSDLNCDGFRRFDKGHRSSMNNDKSPSTRKKDDLRFQDFIRKSKLDLSKDIHLKSSTSQASG